MPGSNSDVVIAVLGRSDLLVPSCLADRRRRPRIRTPQPSCQVNRERMFSTHAP